MNDGPVRTVDASSDSRDEMRYQLATLDFGSCGCETFADSVKSVVVNKGSRIEYHLIAFLHARLDDKKQVVASTQL